MRRAKRFRAIRAALAGVCGAAAALAAPQWLVAAVVFAVILAVCFAK